MKQRERGKPVANRGAQMRGGRAGSLHIEVISCYFRRLMMKTTKAIATATFYLCCMFAVSCKPATQSVKSEAAPAKLLTVNSPAGPDSDTVAFSGWSFSEKSHRWTEGNSSRVTFLVANDAPRPETLRIVGFPNGTQQLVLLLNGQKVYSDQVTGPSQTIAVRLKPGLLVSGLNTLVFELPDARKPGNGDGRVLGFALQSITLQ